ncbi:MAG: sensor histidine kinase [Dokdonella sp.]
MRTDTPIETAPLREQLDTLLQEHRALIQQLQQGQDHFRQLARSVWRVQEDERRRFAHELHDGVGHNITALIHLISEALVALPKEDGKNLARQHLERAHTIAESTLQDTRTLSRLLRPQILDDLGLEQALRWLARTFIETHNLEVEMEIEGLVSELDSDRRTLVFRVAQEALANVAKHSQATHVDIELRCRDGYASLFVRDDGRGGDPEKALARSGESASSGLGGMRDRVRLFGGTLRIESAPDAGFKVTAKFPIHDPERLPS